MAIQYLFAAGHDQVGALQALHTLQPPLFKRYRMDLRTEWRSADDTRPDHTGASLLVGLPSSVVVFAVLTPAELELLRVTFFGGTGQEADVTAQVLNKDLGAFLIYNGTLRWPNLRDEAEYDRGVWRGVRLRLTELVQRTGYSSGFDPLAFGVTS